MWGVDNSSGIDYRIYISVDGSLRIRDSVPSTRILTADGEFVAGTKRKIVVIFDGTNITAYVDGIEKFSPTAAMIDLSSGNSIIGATKFGEPLFGYLKHMRWYDRELTIDEILLLTGA